MKTNTKRKASGFFIVEILIVLAIIAILVTALLPNLNTYTKRAKFADVLTVAESLKPAVELCILQIGTPGSTVPTACQQGTNGIPATIASGDYLNAPNVDNSTVGASGAISVAGTAAVFGTAYTYTLTPTFNTVAGGSTVNWTAGCTCQAAGLC